MFLIYNLLLTLLAPLWGPWMWWRTKRRKEQPNWKERFGDWEIPKREDRRRVWVHAVSVGEVVASLPILREIRRELPAYEIVLSVTTSSGHATALDKAVGLYDHLHYFPIDVARFQLAAMSRVRPDVVAVMETELWFNFLWAAETFGARTVVINGRISDRSFPRSMKIRWFYRPLLQLVHRCLMQCQTDAERIRALGAPDAEVLGNCKYDQALEGISADPHHWRNELGIDATRSCVVVGSLRAEEFAAVGPMLSEIAQEGVQVVVAPRHLERSDELATALGGRVARRSKGERSDGRMLLLDTYGELAEVYTVADVAVVGGGFANLGGQNILQPLAHGKPVLHGPYMQNFRDVAEQAARSGATRVCYAGEVSEKEGAQTLAAALRQLLADEAERHRMSGAAATLVLENVGASRRYAQAIAEEVVKGGR